jgi:hypothetical protein
MEEEMAQPSARGMTPCSIWPGNSDARCAIWAITWSSDGAVARRCGRRRADVQRAYWRASCAKIVPARTASTHASARARSRVWIRWPAASK